MCENRGAQLIIRSLGLANITTCRLIYTGVHIRISFAIMLSYSGISRAFLITHQSPRAFFNPPMSSTLSSEVTEFEPVSTSPVEWSGLIYRATLTFLASPAPSFLSRVQGSGNPEGEVHRSAVHQPTASTPMDKNRWEGHLRPRCPGPSSTPLPGYYAERSEENGEKKRCDTATARAHRVFHSMKQRHDSDAGRATALALGKATGFNADICPLADATHRSTVVDREIDASFG